MAPLVLLVVVFYFVLIRPQQRKAKEHAELLKAVRAGDKVLTTGGVIGKVVTVRDKTLTIRSDDSKLEIAKTAVAEITERSGVKGSVTVNADHSKTAVAGITERSGESSES